MFKTVFVTGGTGYIGLRLTKRLLARGHRVVSFVRPGSERKEPQGAEIAVGNPFDAEILRPQIPDKAVFVQLLGVPHPSPRKRDLFYKIDLASIKASAEAAKQAGVAHFVYVSVAAEPTRIMADYQRVRALGEQLVREKNLPHTFLRPWYVLGPGHWWPLLLWPGYKILEMIPATRRKAKALGLVTLHQMLNALMLAIENPERVGEVMDVEGIRRARVREL